VFVSRITQKLFTDVHKVWWKGGVWYTEKKKTFDFDDNPDNVTLRLVWV